MGNKRIGVVIGRFQGYHTEHHKHLLRAASENDLVFVLIGSANRRQSIKNPFTASQRKCMIALNLNEDVFMYDGRTDYRVTMRNIHDNGDDNHWKQSVIQAVEQYADAGTIITLYGSDKDESTFYLSMFPEWRQSFTVDETGFDATKFREAWFKGYQTTKLIREDANLLKHLPEGTLQYLDWVWKFDHNLQDEWNYYQQEKVMFRGYPYPETLTFSCGDAVVQWMDYILFIQRARNPGKDCWALPGGFKNRDETFADAAERELYEETRINIPPQALQKCVRGMKLFDDPRRSLGIPRTTRAVHFDVTRMFDDFPDVYPADDAAAHKWIRINQLDDHATKMYDDHLFIVKHFI